MNFLVFETDPVVRSDICEALSSEFGQDSINVVDTLETCAESAAQLAPPVVAVLSVTGAQLAGSVVLVSALLQHASVVIIGNDIPADGLLSKPVSFVQRPFSTTQLISVIRRGSPSRPEDR